MTQTDTCRLPLTAPLLRIVSLGSRITRPEKLVRIPLQTIIANIQNGTYRALLEPLRAESDPEKRAGLKRKLPYFVFAVFDGSRAESNVLQANGIVFDLDGVPDIRETKARISEGFPWARYIFRSPVNGLKVLVQFSRPVTDKALYTAIWKRLKAELEAAAGMEADNTPDMCRACFVSMDPDLIGNADALEFDPDTGALDFNTEKSRGEAEKSRDDSPQRTQSTQRVAYGTANVPVCQGADSSCDMTSPLREEQDADPAESQSQDRAPSAALTTAGSNQPKALTSTQCSNQPKALTSTQCSNQP